MRRDRTGGVGACGVPLAARRIRRSHSLAIARLVLSRLDTRVQWNFGINFYRATNGRKQWNLNLWWCTMICEFLWQCSFQRKDFALWQFVSASFSRSFLLEWVGGRCSDRLRHGELLRHLQWPEGRLGRGHWPGKSTLWYLIKGKLENQSDFNIWICTVKVYAGHCW